MRSVPRLATPLVVLVLAGTGPALALPEVTVSPPVVPTSGGIFVELSGFVPGGYDVEIQIGDTTPYVWEVPIGGAGTTFLTIPPGLDPGVVDVVVCAACGQGDLEQLASDRLNLTSGELPSQAIDVQIEAVEITQGIRGDIPIRDFPWGGSVLDETTVHVANRRTVVRVYPAFDAGDSPPVDVAVTATLTVSEGAPLGTEARTISTRIDVPLGQRRGDPAHSIDFVLPDDWVAVADATGIRKLDFDVSVETAIEDPGYLGNNTVTMDDVIFAPVRSWPESALRFRPYFIRHRFVDEAGDSMMTVATPGMLPAVMRTIQTLLPIGDGRVGARLMPWRFVDYAGPIEVDGREVFADDMARRFFPSGALSGNPRGDYHAMLFENNWCAGRAFLNTPYFRSGACGLPVTTVAHELIHAIGQNHAGNGHGEAGGGGYDTSYPDSHGRVEANTYGFDPYVGVAYPPVTTFVPEKHRHDLMSYGPEHWISRYTWNLVIENLGVDDVGIPTREAPSPAWPPALADALGRGVGARIATLSGYINTITGEVELAPLFDAIDALPRVLDGPVVVRVYGVHGGYELELPLEQLMDADGTSDQAFFSAPLALLDGWTGFSIGTPVTELELYVPSANAPTVDLVQPAPGFGWGATGLVVVEWNGDDPDGDALTYRVVASRDGDDVVLATDLTEDVVEIDVRNIPGGGDWTIRVEASDGLLVGTSDEASGFVEVQPPQIAILHPIEGATYPAGEPLRILGTYVDPQMDEDTQLQPLVLWYLDDGWFDEGESVVLEGLSPGLHDLRMEVVNAEGAEAFQTVSFEIVDQVPAPSLFSPENGATGLGGPVPLSWEQLGTSATYRVQVASDPDFEHVLLEQGSIGENVYALEVVVDETYYWRVRTYLPGEVGPWSETRSFSTGSILIAGEVSPSPWRLGLQVAPNPVKTRTSVVFQVPRAGDVRAVVYDVTGARVRTVLDRHLRAGAHHVAWDGRDDGGRPLPSGVYVVEVKGAGLRERVRAVLVR